jgi:hypothetical protein
LLVVAVVVLVQVDLVRLLAAAVVVQLLKLFLASPPAALFPSQLGQQFQAQLLETLHLLVLIVLQLAALRVQPEMKAMAALAELDQVAILISKVVAAAVEFMVLLPITLVA